MNKNYKYILLDLDGTLTNPELGIINCVIYALEKFGIKTEDRKTLLPYIGPPLSYSFHNFSGLSQQDSEEAVKFYRKRYSTVGLFENEVYTGIPELLQKLKEQGKILILATSKPEEFAIQILKHFDLEKYFDFIAAATMDDSRSLKSDVIAYGLGLAGIFDTTEAVMIGDRKYDIVGATENELDSIGVLYGFGSKEELTESGATYIAQTVEDILQFV